MSKKRRKGKEKPVKYEKIDCIHVEREGTMAVYVDADCKGPWHNVKDQRVVYRMKCLECRKRETNGTERKAEEADV